MTVKSRVITILAVLMVLLGSAVPGDAAPRGGHSHRGFHHGGRCCWWGPGLLLGGLALGVGAALTYPLYAYSYPVYAAPPVAAVPPVTYQAPVVQQQAPAYQPPSVQREVVYPNGRYVLYGDGVTQPWQWVWQAAAPPPPPAPPPPR